MPAAIATAGLLRTPALALYARALRRGEPRSHEPVHVDGVLEKEVPGMPNPE